MVTHTLVSVVSASFFVCCVYLCVFVCLGVFFLFVYLVYVFMRFDPCFGFCITSWEGFL